MGNDPHRYRFEHFDIRIMMSDLTFSRAARKRRVVDMDRIVQLSDGRTTTLNRVADDKPLVLITGSLSCPMTVSSLPLLKKLVSEYQSAFIIALVYVREAHPGEHYPQATTIEQKLRNACLFNEMYDLHMSVIVDDLEGGLHRELDTKPNSLHILSQDGQILFQSLWTGDIARVKLAFQDVAGGRAPKQPVSEKMFVPFLRGAGYMHDTLKRAGKRAYRELMFGAPPVWLISRTAGALKMINAAWRGWLAMGLLVLLSLLVLILLL